MLAGGCVTASGDVAMANGWLSMTCPNQTREMAPSRVDTVHLISLAAALTFATMAAGSGM